MRLSPDKMQAIKALVTQTMPRASVYLFGSRADDRRRGGDIDILVVGDRALTIAEKVRIKTALFVRFGEQKIDIVSYPKDRDAPFKRLVLESAVSL